jgi:hypothetical protein
LPSPSSAAQRLSWFIIPVLLRLATAQTADLSVHPFLEDIVMKKLLLYAFLAFAVIGGTATVMTVNSQPAHACPNSNC